MLHIILMHISYFMIFFVNYLYLLFFLIFILD